MKGMKLNESELKDRIFQIYKEEQYKILEKKWNKLSKEDKIFVFEFAKKIYPEQTKLIKESKWYNDYIRGSFEVLSIIKRRNNNQKLCKQFIQKLYIKRKLFLFDGIGCKKFGEKIWMVNQINKSLF